MTRPNPGMLMAIMAMAIAAGGETRDVKPLTPEERERRDAERDAQERSRRAHAAEDTARRQAAEDAAAAPYREARRRRQAAKLARGVWS